MMSVKDKDERLVMGLNDFINKHKGEIFRYVIYKKMFTPLEMEKKYVDESVYESDEYNLAFLTGAIVYDGKIVLELEMCDRDEYDGVYKSYGHKEYVGLDEMRLEWFKCDQEQEGAEEDERE